MKTVASLVPAMFAALLFSTALIALANDKPGSLPATVLSAKTIYVENETADAQFQNSAYTELTKWGRLQIVDSLQKADMVLRLSNGNHVRPVTAEELDSPSAAKFAEGDTVPPGFIRITLVEAKSGNSLWSDQKKNNGSQPPRAMLEGLRNAFEQLEKAHAAK
jgi:hypothetical protein